MVFRKRYNLRFFFTIGLILLFVFFFLLIVQFSQIDQTNSNVRDRNRLEKIVRERKADLNRLKENDQLNQNVGFESEIEKEMKSEFSKTMKSLHRLVHLDLKGSPPKMTYLKEIIPFIKNAGATGVIIEYEDYFPYKNELESISNQNHYTNSELTQIFDLLKEHHLTMIPLIQTYGHLEFVLKLKEFAYLREAKQHFQVITPCLNDTYNKVLYRMIDQILELHPDNLEYIHIGCDEVYHINQNPACKELPHLQTTQDFFIFHVEKIINYIKSKRPNLNVMIWEDMIRKHMIHQVDSNLKNFAKKIVPVVWNYRKIVEVDDVVLKKYDDIFSEIWMASAFKGATKSLELIPDAAMHFSNHMSWIKIMKNFPSPHKLKGMILTGWSRYDHMQAVCEILPAGIPSLVLCLQTLINYDQEDAFIFSKAKELTKCSYNKTLTGFILDPVNVPPLLNNFRVEDVTNLYKCDFPGSDLYSWLLALKLIILNFENKHATYSNILNKYNLKNKFFNTMIYEYVTNEYYPSLKTRLSTLQSIGEKEFDKFFYADLFEELSNVYILRYIKMIEEKLDELNKTKLPESAPIRPFDKIVQSLL